MFRFFKKFRNLKFVHVFQEVWSFKILFMVSKYCLWFQSLFMFSEMFRVSNFYSCFQKYSYFFYSPFLKFVRMFKKCVKILRKIHVEQIVPIFQSINNFEFFSHFQKMAKYKKNSYFSKIVRNIIIFSYFLGCSELKILSSFFKILKCVPILQYCSCFQKFAHNVEKCSGLKKNSVFSGKKSMLEI